MIIGERIREARTRNGWTQEQVAGWTGLSAVEIAHYEAGRRKPASGNLTKLARGLRVSADWLLGLEDGGEPKDAA